MILPLAIVCFFCALVPAIMFAVNLHYYREPPPVPAAAALQPVSILIPARNEAAAIGPALEAALQTRGVAYEIVVMDDNSTDETPTIVQALAAQHPQIRLAQAPPLPGNWNGKQHACWALARAAQNPILCFVDADVRLGPECVARMVHFLETTNTSLVSGFPRQLTGTTLEWLLLPLIHFVLLGFLPIVRMRRGTDPAFAAGCGQFLMLRADHYFACGGHTQIRRTMHDGLRLPKLFRQSGYRTDLADITAHATCRMYTNASQVWSGLAKNATEGLADPSRIVPVSIVLFLGQILPTLLFGLFLAVSLFLALLEKTLGLGVYSTGGAYSTGPDWFRPWFVWTLAAVLFAFLPRILSTIRFRQNWRSAALHPIGILTLLAVQWYSLIRKLSGAPVAWRDRTYTPTPTDTPAA
jgi:glycosyltransferase involved in cell wall biosynthesis